MRTLVDLNRLLRYSITQLMTDDQLDARLPSGFTTREILRGEAETYPNGTLPAPDVIDAKASAAKGRVKGYWHPSGQLSARKHNAEWLPLILEFE